jgi:hypothetical protein
MKRNSLGTKSRITTKSYPIENRARSYLASRKESLEPSMCLKAGGLAGDWPLTAHCAL